MGCRDHGGGDGISAYWSLTAAALLVFLRGVPWHELVPGLEWQQADWKPEEITTVDLRVEPLGNGTRVTLEHRGWGGLIGALCGPLVLAGPRMRRSTSRQGMILAIRFPRREYI